MSVQPRLSSLLAQPTRSMSTDEIKKAFGQTKPQVRRKGTIGVFNIVEDTSWNDGSAIQTSVNQDTDAQGRALQARVSRSHIAPSKRLFSINEAACGKQESHEKLETHLRKRPSRRTIFIPEDTTVMSVHSGHKNEDQTSFSDISMLNRRPRKSSRTSLAKAPKRFPLQVDSSLIQVPNVTIDRAGPATGKENVPPEMASHNSKQTKVQTLESSDYTSSGMNRPTELNDVKSVTMNHSPQPCKAFVGISTTDSRSSALSRICSPRQQPTISRTLRSSNTKRKYEIIEEDIQSMAHYEEAWITSQEVVLTEILKTMLNAPGTERETSSVDLRQAVLDLHHEQQRGRVMSRVKSSLSAGALALPKSEDGSLPESDRYVSDTDKRSRFIKLWTDSYDPAIFEIALQVVTGRQRSSRGAHDKRSLRHFVESCLLLNEDVDKGKDPIHTSLPAGDNVALWSWRRTMYRSLGLILLLDHAKMKGLSYGNLLQLQSPQKTSEAIMNELNLLLRGSSVDAARFLKSIGYSVSYVQDPRSGFDHTIRNIAVDFRDGIRLGRMVDLFRSAEKKNATLDKATFSLQPSTRWTDANLKFPATTKSVMKDNVEKVLIALREFRSISTLIKSIQALEIVNDHREQTISLLWAMVSQFGTEILVDWTDLHWEIRRLESEPLESSAASVIHSTSCQLLKTWMILLANKYNITISNFSTLFSKQPCPFIAIVKEYLPYMSQTMACPQQIAASLPAQLEQIGCGPTFSALFSKSKIIDEDFVVTILAFLASRVLSASKEIRRKRVALRSLAVDCANAVRNRQEREEAARVIQRVWRARLDSTHEKNQHAQGLKAEEDGVEFWLL